MTDRSGPYSGFHQRTVTRSTSTSTTITVPPAVLEDLADPNRVHWVRDDETGRWLVLTVDQIRDL